MLKVHYSIALYFFALICISSCLSAQKTQLSELHDGMHFKISGTLLLKHRGYSSYLVIEANQSYRAVFEPADQRNVHEIGLSIDGHTEALKLHIGERITAEGKLILEPVSPYYYNGVALQAETIYLANGKVLSVKMAEYAALVLPPSTSQYYAQVLFLPHSAKYIYKAWDARWLALAPAQNYLSCSLNGSGELLNCFCGASNFEVAKTGSLQEGNFVEGDAPMPFISEEQPHPLFAQFLLPDPVREKVERTVLCARIPEKK